MLVALVILLIGWFFFVSPTIEKTQSSSDVDLLAAQEQRASLEKQRNHLREVETIFSGLTNAEERRLSAVVSSSFDDTQMYRDLDAFADTTGVQFTQLTISSPDDLSEEVDSAAALASGNVHTVDIQATVAGLSSYPNLVNFLDLMESHLPLMSLDSLLYNPESESFSVRFTAYTLD